MPADQDLRLTDPTLFLRFDSRSVDRGLRYASDGLVEIVEIGDTWAAGDVQGTDPFPYEVDIDWSDLGGRGVQGTCSCPVGVNCKHAVALTVEVALRDSPLAPRRLPSAAPSMPSASARSSFPGSLPATRPQVAWRSALSGIVVEEDEQAVPMALQFNLQQPKPTTYAPEPIPLILVRPMRMGAKGKWIKSRAGWREVLGGYQWNLRDLDPSHLAAVQAIGASVNTRNYSSADNPWPLGHFGPELWAQLRRARELGVVFLDAAGQERVSISDSAAATTVDLTASPRGDGGVALSVGFTHDGTPLDPTDDDVITVGTPIHGLAVVRDAGAIELIALERPVHSGLSLLVGRAPLHIPPSDVDELIDHYQPHLARAASVGSSDGAVTIEPSVLDRLVAVIDHHAADAASIHWTARYRRGKRVTDHALTNPHGAGRNRAAERELAAQLDLPTDLLAGLIDPLGRPANLDVRGPATVTLLTEVVPRLLEQGHTVELGGDAPELREATQDPLIALDVSEPTDEDERTDWFDLTVSVTVDGEDVPFAELFRALTMDEPALILPSGTWLRLDRPELARLRELIDEARGLSETDRDDTVRINRFQSSWWEELAAIGVVERQAQRWTEAVAHMSALSAPEPVPPPPNLDATLRHYQQEGLDWLVFLHRNRLGGILADDMGLGKTVQTLALFLHIAQDHPDARFLVVAPTSVVQNWQRETARFAPDLETVSISQTAARRGCDLATAIGDARVVVTSYSLFRLELEAYQELEWELLVLDEAQFVKNHRSKTYQCVRRLDAAMKLAITGTPLENSLMDLWSLLSITAPGLYPDPQRFSDVYRRPIESGRAPQLLSTLRRRIAPLMRRRTKDQVLTELPPKIEQTVDIELSPRHMRIYQSQLQRQRQKVLGLVDDVRKHRFEILRSLTILRQMSLDPGLVDAEHDEIGSAKLDRLIEDLVQVIAEGHRALVFSTFTGFLARVKERLDDAGIDYAYLDGRTRKRDQAIARFKDGDAPVFVISLKAGGFGLNLTEADYCFVLDPWWNPAAETQAVDRTHRIGQLRPVVVYRYVSVGTIEEKVMALKARKAALFDDVIDGDGDRALAGALQADDIRALIDG